jgi:RND family efflux transporter MFP subunit
MTRRLVLFLIACLAGGVLGCGREAPEESETETVVPVTTAPATVGSIRATVHATGLVSPAPAADLIVIAPEAARIAVMPKAEGDAVRRGDVLVRFEIPSLSADTGAKRADVARANAHLDNARAARVRAHELFERGVAARKEMEDADRELADAEAELQAAQAALSASENLATRTVVHATFDGVVAKRSHNPGDLVEPSSSDPILRVIDPRRLEIIASVPLADLTRVVIGASGRILDGSRNTVATLKVISRPALVEPGTAAAPIRLAISAPSGLAAGTPVQVEIDAEERAGVVLVPTAAIVREGEHTAVFVAAGDKAERREVETGLSDSLHVEVQSGVKVGEQVIVSGQSGLPDGAHISLAPAK